MPRPKGTPKTGGRKKGTQNKATAEVKAIAQEYGSQAIEVLAELMQMADSEAARIAACRELLDRAYGKPQQAVKADVKTDEKLVVRLVSFGSENPSE